MVEKDYQRSGLRPSYTSEIVSAELPGYDTVLSRGEHLKRGRLQVIDEKDGLEVKTAEGLEAADGGNGGNLGQQGRGSGQ